MSRLLFHNIHDDTVVEFLSDASQDQIDSFSTMCVDFDDLKKLLKNFEFSVLEINMENKN